MQGEASRQEEQNDPEINSCMYVYIHGNLKHNRRHYKWVNKVESSIS